MAMSTSSSQSVMATDNSCDGERRITDTHVRISSVVEEVYEEVNSANADSEQRPSGRNLWTFGREQCMSKPIIEFFANGDTDGTPLHLIHSLVMDFSSKTSKSQLVVIVLWGTLAAYLINAPDFHDEFDEDNRWTHVLVWVVSVPLYMYLGIYFVRFLGAFLVRSWVREALESENIQKALMRFLSKVLIDKQHTEYMKDHFMTVSASLLRNPITHSAAAELVCGVLQDTNVRESTWETIQYCLQHEELPDQISQQVTYLLRDPMVRRATVGMGESLLTDNRVRHMLHSRAKSFIQDEQVFKLGIQGLQNAVRSEACQCNMLGSCGNADILDDKELSAEDLQQSSAATVAL